MFAQESVMDIKKEREAFEKHASKFFITNEAFEDDGENYVYDEVKFMWDCWLAAKAKAVPEKDAVIKKLNDQLYAQEMKASAARVLCETACELLDGYAHQDAMVILNDLEQAMKEPAND